MFICHCITQMIVFIMVYITFFSVYLILAVFVRLEDMHINFYKTHCSNSTRYRFLLKKIVTCGIRCQK